MFSDNHKISARQLQALLITDWIGKIVLLLPGLTQGVSGVTVLTGTLAGLLLAAVFLGLVLRAAVQTEMDYYIYVKKRAGGFLAGILYWVYGLYFLIHTSMILYLCGEIASTYLLPEVSTMLLMLLPGITGYYMARGGMEIRGRVSEMTAYLIGGILSLMLILTLFQIRPRQLLQGGGLQWEGMLEGIYLTAAGFGGIAILPLALPRVERTESLKKRSYGALFLVGALLLLTYIASFGIFGAEGMNRLKWPAISLMSCTNLQGVFLQRWDVILMAVLLSSLFLSAGGGIYYMGVVGGAFGKKKNPVMAAGLLISYLLAVLMTHQENGMVFYGKISLYFCVPFLLLTLVCLNIVDWVRKK